MTTSRRRLHLAAEIDEAGDIEALVAQVRAAQEAGFALVTLPDSPVPGPSARVEAGVRAAYLARRTDRIGLAPELHAALTEPFHLSTQLASLDHASLGRAAWVVGAANSPAALATVGGSPLPADGLRQELADVVDVARRLWDSWEDDAVVRDIATGRFLDPDRVHHVAFNGARFSVTGPLITPRPPQGHPVVLGADTLGITGRLDIALVDAATIGEITERARRAREQGAALVFAEAYDEPGLPGLLDRLAGVVDGVRLHTTDLPRLAASLGSPAGTAAGPTLRDTLGLSRPANQFATA
jgi:alkanesulfonate monooxygenase SsuD/methylene tetrahydromethanopterin reductase-like flavin-dependent oxidoreductase (luciferase family)